MGPILAIITIIGVTIEMIEYYTNKNQREYSYPYKNERR